MLRLIVHLTLATGAAMLGACGGEPPRPSAPEAPVDAAASPAAEDGVDPGVQTMHLPDPPAEIVAPVADGEPVASPVWQDTVFPGGPHGGRIVVTALGDPKSFNMMVANETSTTDITNRLYERLLSFNNVTQEVQPGLAHAWEHDESGLVWTFHLRDGLVFSDGSPIDAASVARFFRAAYTEGFVNPSRDMFNVGGEEFTVETPSALTVVIRTPSIYSAMEYQASQNLYPLPAAGWEEALTSPDPAAALNTLYSLDADPASIVCSGPYTLHQYLSGERVVLRRNPRYGLFGADGARLPRLDEVVFRIVPDIEAMRLSFLGGQSDAYGILPDEYATFYDGLDEGRYQMWSLGPALGTEFFWFNLKTGSNDQGDPYCNPAKQAWFLEADFRRACALAVDREGLSELLYAGRATPAVGMENESNRFWFNRDATHYGYDPERAQELLEGLGMTDRDGDGIREDARGNPIRFTMITNRENELRGQTMVLIQEDLRAIGIDMQPSNIDFNALITRINDTFQYEACFLGLTGSVDPTDGLNVYRSSGRTHLWNPVQETPATEAERRMDALCDEMLNTLDREEQRRAYFEIQDILGRECFLVFTVDIPVFIATGNRIGNWAPGVMRPRAFWNLPALFQAAAN